MESLNDKAETKPEKERQTAKNKERKIQKEYERTKI